MCLAVQVATARPNAASPGAATGKVANVLREKGFQLAITAHSISRIVPFRHRRSSMPRLHKVRVKHGQKLGKRGWLADAAGKGVTTLSRAVKSALGPKCRNAMLDRESGAPTVTKGGVTVATGVEVAQRCQNMRVPPLKLVGSRTAATAGDATTTGTALAEALFREPPYRSSSRSFWKSGWVSRSVSADRRSLSTCSLFSRKAVGMLLR